MRNNFDLPALVEHDHGNRIHKVLVRAKEKEELAQGSDFVLRMRTLGGSRRFWASRGDRRSWESSLALDLDGGLLDGVGTRFAEGARHGLGDALVVKGATIKVVLSGRDVLEQGGPMGDRVAHRPMFRCSLLGEKLHVGRQLATG